MDSDKRVTAALVSAGDLGLLRRCSGRRWKKSLRNKQDLAFPETSCRVDLMAESPPTCTDTKHLQTLALRSLRARRCLQNDYGRLRLELTFRLSRGLDEFRKGWSDEPYFRRAR